MTARGIDRLVVLGAAGDLATRHFLPAVAQLAAEGLLSSSLRVVGIDRIPMSDAEYREAAARSLAEYAPETLSATGVVSRLDYLRSDLPRAPGLGDVLTRGPVIAYLALPPSAYPTAVAALRAGGLTRGSRVVVEKPFGQDLASAQALSGLLHSLVDEHDVYRVDHFLYHQTVQDLLALRLSGSAFAPVWNAAHVARVDIAWDETSTVGARSRFYDGLGALRDMVQSHLLQVLAIVAMEPPGSLDERSFRDAKVATLRRVSRMTPPQVGGNTVRARYVAGVVAGRPVPGYSDEPGVDASADTETFAALRLMVDEPSWRGVPFVLRTGKALSMPRRRIAVTFRQPPSPGSGSAAPARLVFEMAPDRIRLRLNLAAATGLPGVEPGCLELARPRQRLSASARMLRDVLAGDPTFMVRDDEVEASWRIVDPVLATWRTGVPPMVEYPAGSAGPVVGLAD